MLLVRVLRARRKEQCVVGDDGDEACRSLVMREDVVVVGAAN